ncbi:hypothetical protein [Flavobacterium sp. 245]|nr:hypothetical protein [Flavobacterium sp. 245]
MLLLFVLLLLFGGKKIQNS